MSNNAQFTIKLAVNSNGVTAGINSAVAQVNKLTNRLAGFGAGFFGAGALIGTFQKIVAEGSKINDMAKKWGTSAKFVQEMIYAASQAGVEIGSLESAFKNFQKSQVAAIEGNEDLRGSFKRAGVDIAALKKLTPENGFKKYLEGMAKLPPSARATTDSLAVLGKSGDAVLGGLRDGFLDAADAAVSLGQVMDDDIVDKLDSIGDRIEALGKRIVVKLAPAVVNIVKMFDGLLTMIRGVGAFAGALSAGADKDQANQAAQDAMQKDIEESIADDSTAKKKKDAKDASDIEEKPSKAGAKSQVNALQNIGARVSTDPTVVVAQQQLSEARAQTKTLNAIDAKLEAQNRRVEATLNPLLDLIGGRVQY